MLNSPSADLAAISPSSGASKIQSHLLCSMELLLFGLCIPFWLMKSPLLQAPHLQNRLLPRMSAGSIRPAGLVHGIKESTFLKTFLR